MSGTPSKKDAGTLPASLAANAGAARPLPALLALALGGFAIGTTEFATMGMLPLFSRDLGVGLARGGQAISAYALGVVVGAPLLAVLGARLSRRLMLVELMAWFAAGNLLSLAAPSFKWLLAFRFVTGLPHGAYFGLAALVAASLVDETRRATAVGQVMLGLTTATVVGVPLANALALSVGWRSAFAVVATLAVLTAVAIWAFAPRDQGRADAPFLAELAALRRAQVWLTLGIGAIGFGGLFAIYTYLVPALGAVTHAPRYVSSLVLALPGVGMTLGTLVVPRFADRALMPTAGAVLLWAAAAGALYPLATHHLWAICLDALAIGVVGALGPVLQTRLMNVAGEAQALAAALNHSAFNTANALGPWLAGLAIGAGLGLPSTGWVACALALGGFALWSVTLVVAQPARSGASRAD